MNESGERDGVATTVIEVDLTPRRNVRRKLVQSTLLPHKPEEVIDSNGDRKCDVGVKEEGEGGGDGGLCSSQGKKKTARKSKEKTPNNGASKKVAKGKSPRKSTPKKSAITNGVVAANQTNGANASPPVPNLRLEAKLRAEENSRMSAGKQIHPFFSSWKGGKRNQEEAVGENGKCQSQGRDKVVTIGPIHVFEKFQDDDRTIDWKNWTFCEQTFTPRSPYQQIKSESLKSRPREFDLNELPTLPEVCIIDDDEPEQYATQSEAAAVASPVGLIACKEDKRGYLGSIDAKADSEVQEVVNLSDCAGGAADTSHYSQSISCRESGQSRNNLWVDKYQPRSASEVCGNADSVKAMNEWLCVWHERGFQPSKEFLSSDEEKSQDADYNCSDSDSDSENIGADCLRNVLLIVGPAGSGKSAAVHACAKEQGFKILESNASECRSGTVVRHKFGEALKSYSLSRSLDPLFNACIDGNGVEDVVEVAPVLHIQNDRANNLKPLIIFEDVDICFAEDRGLVTAIQQIAEKAKGPVVLTANDKNHGLPDNLERIEMCFSLPSTEELRGHLSTVCEAEKVTVDPGSLEQLTMSSGGDIRKAIMQLQFWFQSKSKREMKNNVDPDLFDHEAGHMLLPKIISRGFPSQLSQLVESEIAKSLSTAEESYNTVEVFVEEVENEKLLNRLWTQGTEKNSIEAKKAAMLRQNTCFEDVELDDVLGSQCELSNTAYQQPLPFSRPNRRRKLNVLMSSDSEDEPLSDIPVQENGEDMKKETGEDMMEASCYQYETSKVSCMNEVSQSLDVSCVPESSYVPETLMDSQGELSPKAVSCAHFGGRVEEVSMSQEVVQCSPSKKIYIDKVQSFECLKNTTCEIIAESSDGTTMEDCFKEYAGSSQKMQQVTDECSRIDFGMTLKTAQKPKKLDRSRDPVQETWQKLRSSHSDLKPHLDSEPVEAPQVLDITHQITNLISEADVTHSRCLNFVALEPTMTASGDLDTSGLPHVLEQMTSSVAKKGFSYYTNQIATTGPIPTSSATMTQLTVDEEAKQDYTSCSGRRCSDMKPETPKDMLIGDRIYGILESVVPLRALKGRGFHEYASFIGQISRAHPSNLSGAMEKSRRRRPREARHYLSMDLSPEDITFLGQQSTYTSNKIINHL